VDNLDNIAEQIRQNLISRDEAREKLLPLCRDAIRYSSNAIRAVHRQEFKQAEESLKTARNLLKEAEGIGAAYSELGGSGIIRDAQKEYAEASITLALVTGQSLALPKALGVDAAAYLNGLGEAVGEIRRYLLDAMRQGDLSRGEELLGAMDDIYSVLVTMDFPDAITGGLRRTTDMVRGVLEKTRSDLTLAIRQKELESRLAEFQREGLADIETAPEVAGPGKTEEPTLGEPQLDKKELELYKALAEWRTRKANEENLAPFIIAHNSWLNQIIKLRPKTLKDLNAIKGFGERRINKYGKEIIAIMSEALKNQ
jgi:translin